MLFAQPLDDLRAGRDFVAHELHARGLFEVADDVFGEAVREYAERLLHHQPRQFIMPRGRIFGERLFAHAPVRGVRRRDAKLRRGGADAADVVQAQRSEMGQPDPRRRHDMAVCIGTLVAEEGCVRHFSDAEAVDHH